MDLLIQAYVTVAVVLLLYAIFGFILSIWLRRNDIADIAWGLGFVLISITQIVRGYSNTISLIVIGLVILWAARLSAHILVRLKGKPEDFRYKNWREEWGGSFYLRSFLQVYLLQTVIMAVIALPIIVISTATAPEISWQLIFGILLWMLGFYWQAVGDYQLTQFVKNKPSKSAIMRTGLWSKSRHPNYFGEIAMWWGIAIIVAIATKQYYVFLSPLLITYLLRFVSGVPLLEKKYQDNVEYQQYKKITPMLLPRIF